MDEDADEEVDAAANSDDEEEEEEATAASSSTSKYPPALHASSLDPDNATLLHAAELEAETNGTSHGAFRTQLKEAIKVNGGKAKNVQATAAKGGKEGKEEDLRKIMMSNKKAKLYEKMKYSNKEKSDEVSTVYRVLDSRILSLHGPTTRVAGEKCREER
jgi:pescadillo protein